MSNAIRTEADAGVESPAPMGLAQMSISDLEAELLRLPSTPKTDHDLARRAEVARRRIELVNAERDVAARSPKQYGGYICYVPVELGTNVLEWSGGRIVAEIVDGKVALRIPNLALFRGLISSNNGLLWLRENDALMAELARLQPNRAPVQ